MSEEEKGSELKPGIKVWRKSNGDGPFVTLKKANGSYDGKKRWDGYDIEDSWIVANKKGVLTHFPEADLEVKEEGASGGWALLAFFLAILTSIIAIPPLSVLLLHFLGKK